MRCTFYFLFTLGVLCADSCFAQQKASEKPKVLKQKIKMVEGLRFSPVRFSVKGHDKVELVLENHDPNDQPHNFVLIKPDALAEIQKASMEIGPESIERGFIPEHEGIIVASGLLNPDGKETLSFDVPKEAGVYYYVCTFPGHAQIMYGALYVNTKWADTVAFDPNLPQIIRDAELEKALAKAEVERPTFARLFLPEAGPAAIAVALTEAQNFCWDAGTCRLRYAWLGAFVDPTQLFNSNGS
jgi:azurin